MPPKGSARGRAAGVINQVLIALLIAVISRGVHYVAQIPTQISELTSTMQLLVEKVKDLDKRVERVEAKIFNH